MCRNQNLILAVALVFAATLIPERALGQITAIDTGAMTWDRADTPGLPEGAMRKLLRIDKETGIGAALRWHPEGYVEPRHYHTTAAHSIYVLDGKLNVEGVEAGPGHFFHFPAYTAHGPLVALEDAVFLIWSEGPLDFELGDPPNGETEERVHPAEMRYLGQTPPGTTTELFAPGIVSTEVVELNSVFSPDGREFFFTRLIDGPDETGEYPGRTRSIMHHMVYENGAWSEARPLRLFPDAPHTWTADMAISPDGQLLYFMGPHPVDAEGESSDLNLWVSRRTDDGWSIAEPLPETVNSLADEIYSSVVADGSLYFNRRGAQPGDRSNLFRAQRLADGGFAEAVNVGSYVRDELWVGDTFVAPDESYMVLTTVRPDGFGKGDLYVSFREADGYWGEPINLGPEVNSDATEYCPMVTPDGKYLFFSRRRSDPPGSGWPNVVEGDVYWVDMEVVHRLNTENQ
jgi:hypothetical protein